MPKTQDKLCSCGRTAVFVDPTVIGFGAFACKHHKLKGMITLWPDYQLSFKPHAP